MPWDGEFAASSRPTKYIPQGLFYTQMTPAGELITEAEPGQRYSRVVQAMEPKQEFWQTGTTMAYLAVLYEAVREQWGGEAQARPYLRRLSSFCLDAMQPLRDTSGPRSARSAGVPASCCECSASMGWAPTSRSRRLPGRP